ncbi:MAG: enoyl-CoA hydratase/isomerase family protein [Gammaproteobacteria bacterium]|nr:enoyl-CoA hydratase/isomerase family protein [Gammaproteobacteria bacterium]
MSHPLSTEEVSVELKDLVATLEIHRPPNNFFDFALIQQLAGIYEALAEADDCRAIMLCAEGKNFCAGANFASRGFGKDQLEGQAGQLYIEAIRLFRANIPVVAAVQGAAIGGGLGLAMSADFRVTCEEGRFAANFVRLAFHHGFGLTVTLPRAIGQQRAELMLMTGRRIKGQQAYEWGMADEFVPMDQLRERAWALAREIAEGGPLALKTIHQTMRGKLPDEVRAATDHELDIQNQLRVTEDFKEGVESTNARRPANFKGR